MSLGFSRSRTPQQKLTLRGEADTYWFVERNVREGDQITKEEKTQHCHTIRKKTENKKGGRQKKKKNVAMNNHGGREETRKKLKKGGKEARKRGPHPTRKKDQERNEWVKARTILIRGGSKTKPQTRQGFPGEISNEQEKKE